MSEELYYILKNLEKFLMAETGTSLNSTTEGSLEITPTVLLTNYCYSPWYMKDQILPVHKLLVKSSLFTFLTQHCALCSTYFPNKLWGGWIFLH